VILSGRCDFPTYAGQFALADPQGLIFFIREIYTYVRHAIPGGGRIRVIWNRQVGFIFKLEIE
jgi:hypothetical protein